MSSSGLPPAGALSSALSANNAGPAASPQAYIPASPGPYGDGSGPATGPAAVITVNHGFFLITMNVTTTFPPAAVLPTIYGLLPQSQLQCDHIDVQVEDKAHKLRVQIVGINPPNNPHAVANLASRLKACQPGATLVTKASLTQLSVDSDSVNATMSLLLSSQSRALLDQHVAYYRLHSHPSFMPQLFIYLATDKVQHVINIMRNFMADPIAGGAGRPPRPAGLETKGEEVPAGSGASAPATPERGPLNAAAGTPPMPPSRTTSASSRSPHFKALNSGSKAGSTSSSSAAAASGGMLTLPVPSALDSAISASSDGHGHAASVSPSSPGVATSVKETSPIRVDGKWWHRRRAELIDLATRSGLGISTDGLYVYDLSEVKRNVEALKAVKNVNRIYFACKANCNESVLRTLEGLGVNFECVSIDEIKHVLALFPNIPSERILFTPNFAKQSEYQEAYLYLDQVNVDNTWVLQAWPDVFRNRKVMFRIDPGHGLGYHAHMQTGGARSKFGVTVEQLTAALPTIKELNIEVLGLHVHKGSGIHDATTWPATAQFLGKLLPHFPKLRFLDLGGGFGVQYRSTDPHLDFEKMDAQLGHFRASLPDEHRGLELWVEPGRWLVASAGVLLARVTQLKQKPGRAFVGLSTGMNSLIRPALYESYHEIINLTRIPDLGISKDSQGHELLNTQDESHNFLVDVVGPICETGDVLGNARSFPKATKDGDIVLVDTTGAYGRVMSSNYNLRAPATEVAME